MYKWLCVCVCLGEPNRMVARVQSATKKDYKQNGGPKGNYNMDDEGWTRVQMAAHHMFLWQERLTILLTDITCRLDMVHSE